MCGSTGFLDCLLITNLEDVWLYVVQGLCCEDLPCTPVASNMLLPTGTSAAAPHSRWTTSSAPRPIWWFYSAVWVAISIRPKGLYTCYAVQGLLHKLM